MAVSTEPIAAPDPATSSPSASEHWLWSRSVDLLFGCGLLYAAVFVILLFSGQSIRQTQPEFVFPLLILLVSTPHYGATLVRVYEEADERRRYVLFSAWLSLFVWGTVSLGLFNTALASILATILFTWSPWHYTGQNYGIAILFLRRRGVSISKRAKNLLYASFILSFAMVFLSMNAAGTGPSATPRGYTATNVHFISFEIPGPIADSLLSVLVVAFAATLVGAGVELSRTAKVRDLVPSALLSLAQILWFSGPVLVYRWQLLPGVESLNIEHRAYYFVWAGLAHGIQYLWITSYYGKKSPRWKGVAPYWGKTLLAGAAVWTLPVLILGTLSQKWVASSSGGALSYDTGLALVVAAGVNLHHFMLDGVIWKLRNLRIASALIRDAAPASEGSPASSGAGALLLRRAIWGIAGLALAISVFVFWQKAVTGAIARDRGDYARVGYIQDRLALLNYDSHTVRSQLGDLLRANGDTAESIRNYEASLRLEPKRADVHFHLANALRSDGQTEKAIAHYRESLALAPNGADVHYNLGNALASQAQYIEAITHYRQAIANQPDFAKAYNNLGNALQTLGDLDGAIAQYREALRIQPGYSSANDNLGRALRQKW